MTEHNEHPVLWGLGALVVVAAAIGVLVGIGALGVTRVLGLSGGDSGSGASAGATMVIPSPSDIRSTEKPDDQGSPTKRPHPGQSSSSQESTAITLQTGQSRVAPMQQIDLSGKYPGGDGAILQVQRYEGGTWTDFPVTMPVSGDSFSTFILTGHTGLNRIRVVDTTSGDASNEVKVTVG
ncbi:MAG: hypothetical protein U0R80_01790 [Nocardioidaceae bacterium]